MYRRYVNDNANDYAAYYRVSHDKTILKVIRKLKLPVSAVDFYFTPCVQWDYYFPRSLRFIPHLLDKFFLLRSPGRSFIFMVRLKRAPI